MIAQADHDAISRRTQPQEAAGNWESDSWSSRAFWQSRAAHSPSRRGYLQLDPGVSFPLTAQLPETPKLSLSGAIEQTITMANDGKLLLRLDGSYRSKTYKDPNNVEAVAQAPYALFNGRIAYTLPGDKVTFAVFGTNLTDKRYVVSGLDIASTFSFYEVYYGRPREIGAEVSVKF